MIVFCLLHTKYFYGTKTTFRYLSNEKANDVELCLQGVELPSAPVAGKGAPKPHVKGFIETGKADEYQFPNNLDTAGMANLKSRKRPYQKQQERHILPMPSHQAVEAPVKPNMLRPTILKCPKCGQDRTGDSHKQSGSLCPVLFIHIYGQLNQTNR